MESTRAYVIAGYMAASNMGQTIEDGEIRRAFNAPNLAHWNLMTAVHHFCQRFMENDEHEQIFMDEAQSWFEQVCGLSDEEFANKWKHVQKRFDDARPKRFKQALEINEGAVNVVAIGNALVKAAREVNDDYGNTHKDPAIRLMVGQLAHLTGVGSIMPLAMYQEAVTACEAEVENFTKAKEKVTA